MGDLQQMSTLRLRSQTTGQKQTLPFPICVADFHSLETDTALQFLRALEPYHHHVISIKVLTFGAAKL